MIDLLRVVLRTPDLMGADNDSLDVFDIKLEALEPVSPRSGEIVEAQRSMARKHLGLNLFGLQGAVEFPAIVRDVEIVRRDKNLETVILGCVKNSLQILDGLVFFDAVARNPPPAAL